MSKTGKFWMVWLAVVLGCCFMGARDFHRAGGPQKP